MSQYIFINLLAETLISWSDFLLSISVVNDCTKLGSSIIEQILSASSLDLLTSNNIPLFLFIYSVIPPIFDPITGVPHAIASKPTSPSGSSLDGKINIEDMPIINNGIPNMQGNKMIPVDLDIKINNENLKFDNE